MEAIGSGGGRWTLEPECPPPEGRMCCFSAQPPRESNAALEPVVGQTRRFPHFPHSMFYLRQKYNKNKHDAYWMMNDVTPPRRMTTLIDAL